MDSLIDRLQTIEKLRLEYRALEAERDQWKALADELAATVRYYAYQWDEGESPPALVRYDALKNEASNG